MDADFSIELGQDDPVLDFPWTDPSGKLVYVDVKRHPDLLKSLEEATAFPELADFLRIVNSARSPIESAKCDVWSTSELTSEETFYDASWKLASYVDMVFSSQSTRRSFSTHEEFVKKLVALLRRAPEILSAAEACVRRCYYGPEGGVEGFYCTLYISGYGEDESDARRNWGVALKLVANAIVQILSQIAEV